MRAIQMTTGVTVFCSLERKRSQNGIRVLGTNKRKKKKCISDHESKKD